MNLTQKENLDSIFKGFIMVALTIIGFFAARSMNTIDRATSDIEQLKISGAVMQNDISRMNDNWKRVFEIETAKQLLHQEERKEDAKK